MSKNPLLKPEVQKYILEKTGDDSAKLAFQKNPFLDLDFKDVLNQIEARRKCKNKLPTWFNTENIIYPSKISIEQTSSEHTALYKSEIVSGDTLIDLSGGFGVDDFYFSKLMKNVIHCEINEELSEIVSHNFNQLKCQNITCYQGDSLDVLNNLNQKVAWIYIDPSRRNEAKGKVFLLKDCLPNVPELQDFYYTFSDSILIKTAPLLDIAAGLNELKNVKSIHIVAVENEVKELLWEIEKGYSGKITIKTHNINKTVIEKFNFQYNEIQTSNFSLPKAFIYEPNAAIMKSGGFAVVGNSYNLEKLHFNSHLFTSTDLKDFPGRIFNVEKTINYSKNEMKLNLELKKANISVRNFPDTVENIRKKWKIKDGGNQYCFFTTDKNDNKIVLICTKINK